MIERFLDPVSSRDILPAIAQWITVRDLCGRASWSRARRRCCMIHVKARLQTSASTPVLTDPKALPLSAQVLAPHGAVRPRIAGRASRPCAPALVPRPQLGRRWQRLSRCLLAVADRGRADRTKCRSTSLVMQAVMPRRRDAQVVSRFAADEESGCSSRLSGVKASRRARVTDRGRPSRSAARRRTRTCARVRGRKEGSREQPQPGR